MSNENSSAPAAEETAIESLSAQMTDPSNWLPDILLPLWKLIASIPYLGALSVVLVFYIAALLVRSLILANLQRLASKTSIWLDHAVISHLRPPVFNTVFLFGLILAVHIAALSVGREFLVNLLASVIIVSWLLACLKISSDVLDFLGANPRFTLVENRTIPLFDLLSKLIIILVASYILLIIWGINPMGWLASAGIVGIAVGFAAKDTLANLFSGFFILADAPYKLGDYINLDTGERGKITAIGMRSTRLLTRDDVEITVPNAVIANAKITNESGGPYQKIRARIAVGAAYGSDVDQVCAVMQEIADQNDKVAKEPAPRVRMRAFGASSLDFELLFWIDLPEQRGLVSHELFMAVYKAFAREGIEIPYSKHDVYIKEMADSMHQEDPD